MKRREFIKNTGITSFGIGMGPYILPSGSLFEPTGSRIANHVVYCMFAGGIRNFESIQKKEGNLTPLLLNGTESVSSDIKDGIASLPITSGFPLQQSGTLYKEFRYNNHKNIHFTAQASAIMGMYSPNTQMMRPLNFPSVFEYYRKHTSPSKSAINAWWVSDQAGPFTFLNYSDYTGYGPLYGANMLQPTSFFNDRLAHLQNFDEKGYEKISRLQTFFNQHALVDKNQLTHPQIENTLDDVRRIEKLLENINQQYVGTEFNPFDVGKSINEDIMTMYAACEILRSIKPELLVVNMQHSDIAHINFTQYCNNMHKADFALYQLWRTIQQTPGLKDDTILIAAPDFGRDALPNTLRDGYGRLGVDHTGDENSEKIFCLIAGPPDKVVQNQEITTVKGETIDIVPTIAKILGFDHAIPPGLLKGQFLQDAFRS